MHHLHCWLFAILMLICSPVPTSLLEHISSFSLSFYSIPLSVSVYVLLCLPLHPPTYCFPVPQSPISVCCHAPMSPIRKGNEARYRCKYLGPLAAPCTHHPQTETRMSEEERREGMEEEVEGHADKTGKNDLDETYRRLVQNE